MNINDNVKECKSSGNGWRGQQAEKGGGEVQGRGADDYSLECRGW